MATEEDVLAALRRCYDPCCRDRGISVVDMGLVEDIRIDGPEVTIELVLTTGWCPFVVNLQKMITEEIARSPGVQAVSVDLVWDRPWTMDRLSESARAKLEMPLEQLLPYRKRLVEERRTS